MPTPDNPDLTTFAMGTASGLVGGGWVALSRPMTRREVFFCLFGGVGIGAFIPPLVIAYTGWPSLAASGIGFVGGVSVFGVFAGLQGITNKFMGKVASGFEPEKKP